MDFSTRSNQLELLDRDDIPFDAIRQNMHELDIINTYLGGHRITISGFNLLAGPEKKISVCEIGCGGGDNLMAIQKYCLKKNIHVESIGIDINPECIAVARSREWECPTEFVVADCRAYVFEKKKPDIVFSSLFCHHFRDEEIITMLKWMQSNAHLGFFINDLHRHYLAYHSIKILVSLFSKSYLVKNDAPLSVLRGFTHNEWRRLLEDAGMNDYKIDWKWAFRWLIIHRNQTKTTV